MVPARALTGDDGCLAATLATDILALNQDAFSAAFRKSPMKRAKLAGMRRNAAVMLRNLEAAVNVPPQVPASPDYDPGLRSHHV